MRTIRVNRDFKGKKLMSRITSIVIGVVGFIMSMPFMHVIMFGEHQPYMSLARIGALLIFIIGGPMVFAGIFGFMIAGKSGGGSSSTTEVEVGRMRHAMEMDRMNRK